MFRPVILPLWLFLLILLFAMITFASHFLFPSVRWFFRRRAERLVAKLNRRLTRPIEPFKLARRYDMIQRLTYDAEVNRAVHVWADERKVPEAVGFEEARRIAREIVPRFSASVYFGIGIGIARRLSRAFYRVRVGTLAEAELRALDPQAAVVFVISHRSNMDYVLVTWLVSRASALSYAVGEWANIPPLSALIRAMGAYFIRRKDRSRLYRKVLARYVQMSVEGGVTQAIFPEGGLSLDGRPAPPKLGLITYIAEGALERDVIFVPVGINYDRIIEDSILIAADARERRFNLSKRRLAAALGKHVWLRLAGRFAGFGSARVSFGEPLALREFRAAQGDDPEALAQELMARIAAVIPALPVPMVARALLAAPEGLTMAELEAALEAQRAALPAAARPDRGAAELAAEGRRLLLDRDLVQEGAGGRLVATATAGPLLGYYANTIAHHFEPAPVPALAEDAPG